MKVKHLSITLLITVCICTILNQHLFSEEKGNDPINNSYIINNLQMESDTNPSANDQNPGDGEIIFDNTFDDNFTRKSEIRNSGKSKKILNKIAGKDKRVHLTEYRIKRNESLWSIAKKSNVSVDKLIEINNIKNPEHLRQNDILLIPSNKGIFYKIRKGDTLTRISQKYNVEIDIIAEHNNIDGRKIIAGKKIFLPDADEPLKETPIQVEKNIRDKHEVIEKIATIDKNSEKKSSKKVVFSWPLRGPITSGFGIRTHPFSGDKKFHCGMDIGAEEGSIIRSAGEGTVIFSGWKDAYGNMVVISHENNFLTIYAHNSRLLVGVNEKIKKGQKIALSGKTGAVTGAHLHFEIRKGIVPLNPLRILK